MKKNVIFIGVSIILLILLGIGVSYSMWNMSNMQDTTNVISTTECFDISITSQENSIKLENAYPISDAKGKSLTPFTFTIKNTCDIVVSYSINLESLKGTTLSSEFLKVMINNISPKKLNSYEKVSIVNSGSIESRVLDTGTIYKNKIKEYSLRLWMDYDTTMEDLDNEIKSLKAKIVVTGVPSTEEEPSTVLLTDKITEVANSDTVDIATDDPDNNIRYIGADPNNYVYFNCSDYNNQSDSTCEKWRIIGLFNNITKSDGTKENLIKIIRYESIGAYSLDNKNVSTGAETDYGKNDWTTARLSYLLNPGYESESVGGSLYYNAKSGTCYYGQNNATTSCDFSSTGLKNDTTKNAIESVVWNLGGSPTFEDVTASMFYERERGTTVYSGRPTTWTGKIGLMYPSDYGYATAGGSSTSRSTCLSTVLYSWDSSSYSDCKGNDYLHKSSYYQWTLAPNSSNSGIVFLVGSRGAVYGYNAHYAHGVRPTLYLKSNLTVIDGSGSSTNPYKLGLQ